MPLFAETSAKLASGLIVAALLIAAMVLGKAVLLPFALSVILAFMMSPVVNWLAARRLPHAVGVGLTVLVVVVGSLAAAAILSAQLLSLTADLGNYRTNLVEKVRSLSGGLSDGIITRASRSIEVLESAIKAEINGPQSTEKPSVVVTGKGSPESVVETIELFVHPVAQAGLTLLFALFLLLQQHDIRDRLVRVLGTDNMTETTNALSDAGDRLSRFLLLQAVLNASFGALVGVALFIIGVPSPWLWAIATFLLRFVPFIGSFLSAIPPILLAAAVDPGWGMALATLLVFLIGEPVMGNLVEPVVLGRGIGLSPIAIVVAASFWALVWGPFGLILAAPLTMALVLVGQYVPKLAFLEILLGDAPALTPEQEFYHRLLVADVATAGGQLAHASEDSSVIQAADTVLMPALRLAARDFRAGRLDRDEAKELTVALRAALGYLPGSQVSEARTNVALPDKTAQCVVVPAQGPIDVISAMAGAAALNAAVGAAFVPVDAASGLLALSVIKDSDDLRKADTLVISTVGGIEGRHLRLIAKRARTELPHMRIVVASWADASVRETIGGKGEDVMVVSRVGEIAALLPSERQSEPDAHPVPVAVTA